MLKPRQRSNPQLRFLQPRQVSSNLRPPKMRPRQLRIHPRLAQQHLGLVNRTIVTLAQDQLRLDPQHLRHKPALMMANRQLQRIFQHLQSQFFQAQARQAQGVFTAQQAVELAVALALQVVQGFTQLRHARFR